MEPEEKKPRRNPTIRKLGGRLHRVVPVLDSAGRLIQYAVSPLKVELRQKDVLQVIVGASLFAVPVGFTEEIWGLASSLPTLNIAAVASLSLILVATYVHFNFYRGLLREHLGSYLMRVAVIYLLSLSIVAIFLTLIDRAPWLTDPLLATKRVLLVGFPATMSAAISDAID